MRLFFQPKDGMRSLAGTGFQTCALPILIDLGAGARDSRTPPIAADAGVRGIREGKTHYPANEGILELRAAAATQLSLLSGGRPVNADHIVISNGSKQSLFNVCFSVFGPGDVVAIPAPAWVSYPQIVHLTRARPILVPGAQGLILDRKSTCLNSSHSQISYAVFC